jgi:2-polyprenyl-3-methyl-5-hydroxy-6-metoxy-1,4-benzoquinol methylase
MIGARKAAMRDRAGRSYWERVWGGPKPSSSRIDPHDAGVRNHVARKYHDYFLGRFAGMDTRALDLLEIGCGRSEWLPYFAREHGFRVFGLDYSPLGCEQARHNLAASGVDGTIYEADAFAPPDSLRGRFDVVVSLGVFEHFDDSASCARAFARFVRPGGLMITLIPNMRGLPGLLQRELNRPVFDIHTPLDRDDLIRSHTAAGLVDIRSDYLVSLNFWMVNLQDLPAGLATRAKRVFLKSLQAIAIASWCVDPIASIPPPNRWLSPYLFCDGRVPAEPTT